jgi:hypothetical protein
MGLLGISTLVQEHSTFASVSSKGSLPEFSILYSNRITFPLLTKPKFFFESSIFKMG